MPNINEHPHYVYIVKGINCLVKPSVHPQGIVRPCKCGTLTNTPTCAVCMMKERVGYGLEECG